MSVKTFWTPEEDARVTWRPVEHSETVNGIPVITHEGAIEFAAGLRLVVYQLSDGQRVVPEESMRVFLEWLSGGPR